MSRLIGPARSAVGFVHDVGLLHRLHQRAARAGERFVADVEQMQVDQQLVALVQQHPDAVGQHEIVGADARSEDAARVVGAHVAHGQAVGRVRLAHDGQHGVMRPDRAERTKRVQVHVARDGDARAAVGLRVGRHDPVRLNQRLPAIAGIRHELGHEAFIRARSGLAAVREPDRVARRRPRSSSPPRRARHAIRPCRPACPDLRRPCRWRCRRRHIRQTLHQVQPHKKSSRSIASAS